MKMFFFLAVLAAATALIFWRTRKADSEKELARHKAMKRKQQQRKHAITATHHEKWPTIIHAAGKPRVEEEEEPHALAMSSIDFERVDHPRLHH